MNSGLRTPTSHGGFPLPLGTPGAGQPTTGVTVGDQMGHTAGIGFGLREPPKMRKAMSRLNSEGPAPSGEAGSADSPFPQQVRQSDSQINDTAATESSTPVPNGSIRGMLSVKLISAKGLAVSHGSNSEPYVVMQFEQNEFISAGPLPASSPASVPFTTSTAQPMMPNLPRSSSALGVGTISRAFADAMSRGKGRKEEGMQTPKAEEPAGGGSWLGKPGPGDPVWKEEVAL
jgi:hypothetical protein